MITCDPEDENITATRHIYYGFPRSQHRPVFIFYGLRIPQTRSIPQHRWNFARADWDKLARDLDYVVQFIPAVSNSYERFAKAAIAAAKRHIPRGYRNQYIPGWDQECNDLYNKYNTDRHRDSAVRLLEKLNEQRRSRWENTVEKKRISHTPVEKLEVY
jgi:hypothetical protein